MHICLPNYKFCTKTSKKLCYQTQKGFWNSSKISISQHFPTFYILLKYLKHPTHSPSFHHLLRLIIFLLPFLRKITQEEDPKHPLPQAFHDPSLSLFFLSNGSYGNLSLQSMAFSSFKNQWESKMICLPMEFRMRILMPNETLKGFHPLIK
jgi:hypothetical protein